MYSSNTLGRIMMISAAAMCLFSCGGRESKTDYFKRISQQYTEGNCPSRFPDGITTLDSLVFDDSDDTGTQKLYYTLEVDSAMRQMVIDKREELEKENLNFVRNSVIFAKQKEDGVRFKFVYYDSAKKDKILECIYTKEDYQ